MESDTRWNRGLAARGGTAAAMTAGLILLSIAAAELLAQGPPQVRPPVKLGLSINDTRAFRGYTLLNAMGTKTTYLIDMEGRVVKSWESPRNTMSARLLENGDIFRLAGLDGEDRAFGGGPGAAGRIEELTWDGDVVWDFKFFNEKQLPHHDAARMPNGDVLMVVWDKKNTDEAINAGRKKELISNYVLPDSIVEIKPTGKTTGEVVWEWHLWDHLVQDHDSTKANYGDVSAHPELVDINFVESPMGPGPGGPGPGPGGPQAKPDMKKVAAKDARGKDETAKLKSIGYVGSPTQRSQRINPDWTHVNAVDYNPALDQIVISVHEFSEIWIIDHSTTKAEAAGHTGGRSGKGGDLLYRWGNPRVYRAGTKADQRLFVQHNAQWIRPGLPGAGHLLVFNNGGHRPDGDYSSVDEIVLPVDEQGRYALKPGGAYGPDKAIWSYTAAKKSDFYSSFISGTHRLPNGNTMICSGANGTLFEVTPDKQVVWKYINPVKGGFGGPGGPGGGPQRPAQILVFFVRDMMGLSPDQRTKVDALQKTVDDTLEKLLTEDQKKTLRERSAWPGGIRRHGGARSAHVGIDAGDAQADGSSEREADRASEGCRCRAGKDPQGRSEDAAQADPCGFRAGGPPGGPPGGRPGGGPPGGGGGGPPPGLFAGPPGGGAVFRAYRYGPDYAGLSGRDLKPGKTVEELQPKDPEPAKGSAKSKDASKK